MKVLLLLLVGLVWAQENTEFFGPVIPTRSLEFPDGFARIGALESLQQMTGATLEVTDEYTDEHNGVTHMWTRQLCCGIPIQNAVGNLNIKDGQVLSNFDRFTTQTLDDMTRAEPRISVAQALQHFSIKYVRKPVDLNRILVLELNDEGHQWQLEAGDFAVQPMFADLMFLELEDGSLELIYQLNIDMDDHWYEVSVSAMDGQIMQLYDLVHYYSYNAFPMHVVDPEDTPGTRELLPEHIDPEFAPLGWHDWGQGTTFTNTQGNNVRAQENLSGTTAFENNYRPTAIGDRFDFPLNLNLQPDGNLDAAITNLFYHNNIIHDVYYQYGFNEISGNFQYNNFGRGGRDRDPVTAHCQDGSGSNNANFATPADGSPGRMRMYTWSAWNPRKDGDFDSGIIYHEFAHGISNRLTGGPTQTGCVSGGQAAGMGEGWGDFTGLMFRTRPEHNRNQVFGTGTYVTQGITIRNWVYSSDRNQAPQTYTYSNGIATHQIGCIWSSILFEVYWNMIDRFGFDQDWLHGSGGNNIMMQILTDGMKFQPCRPTFVQARDSILDSALSDFGLEVYCLAWNGFASRGLGTQAPSTPSSDSFTVPAECQ